VDCIQRLETGTGASLCERALNHVLLGCDTVWFSKWTLWPWRWRYHIPPKLRYPCTVPRPGTQSERSTQWRQTTLWTFGLHVIRTGNLFTSGVNVSFTSCCLVNGLYYCCVSLFVRDKLLSAGVVFDSTLNSSVVPTFPPRHDIKQFISKWRQCQSVRVNPTTSRL